MFYSSMGDDIETRCRSTVAAGGASPRRSVRDRGGLRLRVPRGLDDGGTSFTPVVTNLSSPAANDQSGFNTSGAGIDGSSGGGTWVTDRDRAGRDERPPLPLQDRRRGGRKRLPRGRHRPRRGRHRHGRDGRRRLDPSTGSAGRRARRRACTSTRTSPRTASTTTTTRRWHRVQLRLPRHRPDWVESYPYQNGLLINYWDDVVRRQQRRRPPGRGLSFRRRAPDVPPRADGHLIGRGLVLRLDLRAEPTARSRSTTTPRSRSRRSRPASPLRRHQGLVVRRRRAHFYRRAPRPLPARLEQRRRAEDGDADPRQEHECTGQLHAGRGQAREVAAGRWRARPAGRGKPRPAALCASC